MPREGVGKHMLLHLTHTDVMVIICAAYGLKDCETAKRLGLTNRAVEYHWGRVRAKLKVNNRPQAVMVLLCELHAIAEAFPGISPPRTQGGH